MCIGSVPRFGFGLVLVRRQGQGQAVVFAG
jgi:hypothetical protein